MSYYKHKPRKDYNRVYSKAWRKKYPEKRILIQARNRAKTLGIPFDISIEDIKIPEVCPVLGIKLNLLDGNRFWDSPSLDRIDCSKGYVKDNVKVISGRANVLKRDATLAELSQLVVYLREYL